MNLKPETQAAIQKMPLENRQNLLRFILTTMDAAKFAAAFCDADGDLTETGDQVAEAFGNKLPDEFEEENCDRLHEAICEGRRQDAVDLLNEITGMSRRSVAAQMNLFPDRITL